MIEMSNKRPPIAINKGKRKSLATLLFLLVSIEIILAIIKKITIKQPIIPAIRKVVIFKFHSPTSILLIETMINAKDITRISFNEVQENF